MKSNQPSLLPPEDAASHATLNDQQQAAVEHTTGPLLIIAGAGTGKTKTLTNRIAHLIERKLAKPSEILALTFTDKAAGEMETRVDELLPYGQTDATISTFNAFGDQLLREHALDIGLPPEFQILGQTEQELFLSDRFDEIEGLTQLRPTGSPRKFVAPILQVISRAKDELVTPERYAEVAAQMISQAKDDDEAREASRQVDIATIYAAYEQMKAERGVIDFGDQILLLHRLLEDRPSLRTKLQERYHYILVDEFQDTNVAQYQLVKQLLGSEQNLTVVGDDDQCLPAATAIKTPSGTKPIESITAGDTVITAIGKGELGTSTVNRTFKRTKDARFLTFTLANGLQLTATDNHKFFCRVEQGKTTDGSYYVYLMQRRNLGWRLGVTNDLITRLALERSADRIVGLRRFPTEADARFHETLWSLQYSIPTVAFKPRLNTMIIGPYLERLYRAIDTNHAADLLAQALRIDLTAHHACLDGVKRGGQSRTKIIISLCTRGYRSKQPGKLHPKAVVRHLVSIETSDQAVLKQLTIAGLSINRAKVGWRNRKQFQSLAEAGEYAETLRELTGGIVEARFTVGKRATQHKHALVMPAGNVLPGMYLPVAQDDKSVQYEQVIAVQERYDRAIVYDLEIDRTHNFIANDIVVHNSIYKFRGAAVSNILGFLKDFPTAKQVILTHNYRSSQTILDAAYKLVVHNNPDRLETKLGIDKHLVGADGGVAPTLKWYEHEADELTALVESLKQVVGEGRKPTTYNLQPTTYRDIAILVRSNNLISTVAQALTRAGIPYVASRDDGFVNLPEVRGIAAFLSVLVHSDDSLGLLKLMLSPYYQFPAEWVIPLSDAARKANRPLHDVLFDDSSVAWQRVPKEGIEPLQSLRDDLSKYRRLIAAKNPGEILYEFLRDRGVLDRTFGDTSSRASLSSSEEKASGGKHRSPTPEETRLSTSGEIDRLAMVQNVAAVFEAISGYIAAGRDPFAFKFVDELPALLATIKPPSTNQGPDVDAVQLMTVHAAKGLEFETVFLPSLMADRFPARRRSRMLELPNELIAEQLPTGDEHEQEERRLMYVALTRAKRQLYLSGSERVGSGVRLKKLSPFMIEALDLPDAPAAIVGSAASTRITDFAPTVPVPPTIAYPSYGDVLFLSPAAIETYLNDPYNFYWKSVLKAPQPPSRHLVYGNAIHSAIEGYYQMRRSIAAESDSSEVNNLSSSEVYNRLLTTAFARYTEAWKSEGFESQTDENIQFEHGRETIERFIKRAASEPLPELVEHSFTLGLPGVKIKGRIDALFSSLGEIRDFKTSKVGDQKEADKKLRDNIPIRIYALAFKEEFGRLPSALVLDFVEHDLKASLVPTEKLLEETKALIAKAVEGIKAGNFAPNPANPFPDYE